MCQRRSVGASSTPAASAMSPVWIQHSARRVVDSVCAASSPATHCSRALGSGAAVSHAGAAEAVRDATVTLPPAGLRSHALWDSWHELAPFGYREQEYFVSGVARDATGASAPYMTRIIVTRPTEAKRFNGTAVLDWTNVTAQFENGVDTMEARPMRLGEGLMYLH